MSSLIRDHMERTWFAGYQDLRPQLMGVLSDEDLAFRPGGATYTFGQLCREIGDIEHSYVEAVRTFRQDFEWHNPDPRLERSVAALSTWFGDLDRDLQAAIDAVTEDDAANRRFIRADIPDFSPLLPQELDIYREALLIFYGKASIYLRALDRDLPGDWPLWIG
ncbi:MAG TPA: hypothetical protein VFN41_02205 [Candidatus Limnocylindrales bacterium]|nr:hypothetical protein [Candidatus Limnocylindrales bacterium]